MVGGTVLANGPSIHSRLGGSADPNRSKARFAEGGAVNQEIADYEDLKERVEAVLAAAVKFFEGAAEEDALEKDTNSFAATPDLAKTAPVNMIEKAKETATGSKDDVPTVSARFRDHVLFKLNQVVPIERDSFSGYPVLLLGIFVGLSGESKTPLVSSVMITYDDTTNVFLARLGANSEKNRIITFQFIDIIRQIAPICGETNPFPNQTNTGKKLKA